MSEGKAARKRTPLTAKVKSDIDKGPITDDHVEYLAPIPLLRSDN